MDTVADWVDALIENVPAVMGIPIGIAIGLIVMVAIVGMFR